MLNSDYEKIANELYEQAMFLHSEADLVSTKASELAEYRDKIRHAAAACVRASEKLRELN